MSLDRDVAEFTVLIRDGNLPELIRRFGEMSKRHARRVVRHQPYVNWYGTLLHMAARHDHRGRCPCSVGGNFDPCSVVFTDPNRIAIVMLLIDHGAQRGTRDNYDNTAYDNALLTTELLFSNQAIECLPELLNLLNPF